jgi:hypothetical protein
VPNFKTLAWMAAVALLVDVARDHYAARKGG